MKRVTFVNATGRFEPIGLISDFISKSISSWRSLFTKYPKLTI